MFFFWNVQFLVLLFSVFRLGQESIFVIFSDDAKREKKAVNKIDGIHIMSKKL